MNIKGNEIIARINCQSPVFVRPPTSVPKPGKIRMLRINAAIAIPCDGLFFREEDFDFTFFLIFRLGVFLF